jgi:hypothetical protein
MACWKAVSRELLRAVLWVAYSVGETAGMRASWRADLRVELSAASWAPRRVVRWVAK